jgi:hypothetical protein
MFGERDKTWQKQNCVPCRRGVGSNVVCWLQSRDISPFDRCLYNNSEQKASRRGYVHDIREKMPTSLQNPKSLESVGTAPLVREESGGGKGNLMHITSASRDSRISVSSAASPIFAPSALIQQVHNI